MGDNRGRRRLAVGVVAAVVLAATGAIAYQTSRNETSAAPANTAPPSTAPEATTSTPKATVRIEDLPLGRPTDVPWWQAGVLHVGGQTVATHLRSLVYRGGTTLIGRSGTAGNAWYLVERGRTRPLVSSDQPLVPVVSSDGSRIAWVERTRSTQRGRYTFDVDYRIVEYNVRGDRVIGSLDRGQRVQCCDAGGSLFILGITLDGSVLVSSLGRATVTWRPGHEPVKVTGVGSRRLDGNAWPGGVTWQGYGEVWFDTLAEYGDIGTDGAIHRVGEMPTDQVGAWSPDGTAYAYPGIADGSAPGKVPLRHIWVRTTTAGEPVELELPSSPSGRTAPSYSVIAWESEDAVIVEARQAYGRKGEYPPGLVQLLRCSATSGACERVADGPTGKAVLPDPW